MRVVGIITARGGSKGIPRKNIRMLLGKPLLQYTTEAALSAQKLSRVILSTDNNEIADLGLRLGVEVPFLRPAELARDNTPSIPVLQHAVRWLQSVGDHYDAIFVLQPTTPLRQASDIDGAIQLLECTAADSVISYVDVGERHPARMKFLDPEGRIIHPPFAEAFEGQRRQDLPKMYLKEGSVYCTRMNVLMQRNSLQGDDCRAWLVPRERACNIDEPFDLLLAQMLLQRRAAGGLGESEHTLATV
jgi:CMP-N-acetylneuraminic acid synthetase